VPTDRAIRLAIISTPRSGNSWIRCLFRELYQLAEIAVHSPGEIPDPLPLRVVLQLHWPRTDTFAGYLKRHRFTVFTIARHPLDVLVSMVHYAKHEPATARWLDGAGDPRVLVGTSPVSAALVEFASSPAAEALFAVTSAWWTSSDVIRLRYEDLVQNPEAQIEAILPQVGPPRITSREALDRCRLGIFQAAPNRQGWRGEPGLWRRIVPPRLAERIHRGHPEWFAPFGYACDPDPALDPLTALHNWREVAAPPE